jgi:predicted lipoprotein with Yx(FWY)xxD motif
MGTTHPGWVVRPAVLRAVLAAAALVGALAVLLAATHASAASTGAQVKVDKSALGRILVSAQGRTLYMFAADKRDKSACYGNCATYWPPLLTISTHVTGSGVNASMLGSTKRTDGKLQITYNGHPLYRFVKDTKSGQTSGQGVNAFGGLWWVVSPSGTAIKKKPGSTNNGGGGGGGYGGGYGG